MKMHHSLAPRLITAVVPLCAVLLAGCASKSGYQQADKTGEAINTVRNDIASMKIAVDNSMKCLDALAASATTDPRKPFEAYAKSVDKVESAAAKAQKNADEMRERSAAYFQQWEQQIGTVKNENIRKLAQERRAKLQETFGKIKESAQDTKTSFPPFLSDLKDLRTGLSADLTPEGIDAAKDIFLKTKTTGTEVQKNLDKLITEMNTVFAAITAAKASKQGGTAQPAQPPAGQTPAGQPPAGQPPAGQPQPAQPPKQ
jgi:hypothetical protein